MQTSQKTLAVNNTTTLLVWSTNNRRTFLNIQNQSAFDLLVNVGAYPSSSNALIIPPGEEWSPVNPPRGDIRITGTFGVSQKLFTIEEST